MNEPGNRVMGRNSEEFMNKFSVVVFRLNWGTKSNTGNVLVLIWLILITYHRRWIIQRPSLG